MNETLILYTRDFFGDATAASLAFYRDGNQVHRVESEDGIVAISMPDQLEPGVYDIVAERGDASYRITDMMVPLQTHYFRHASLHSDLKLRGGNFSGEPIQDWKVSPIFYDYLSRMPDGLRQALRDISLYSGHKDSLLWGGAVSITSDGLRIGRGEARLGATIASWDTIHISLPFDPGTYYIGVTEGEPSIYLEPPQLSLATLVIDAEDWKRLEVHSPYHTIYRGGKAHLFIDYLLQSADYVHPSPSGRIVSGLNRAGLVYGASHTTAPASEVEVRILRPGPVLATDRLYIYSTENYVLLWEESVLLAALPRYVDSRIRLIWGQDRGLTFDSFGEDGHVRFFTETPFSASNVIFCEGSEVIETRTNLQKIYVGFHILAGYDFLDWPTRAKTENATLTWDGGDIASSILPTDALQPSDDFLPLS